MSKHTPGPWRTVTLRDGTIRLNAGIEPGGHTIGMLYGQIFRGDPNEQKAKSEGDANSHLVAAAPDLLAACEMALGDGPHNASHGLDFRVVDALRAAIAKAKGGA